jgi:hypothetical protein
MTHAGTKPAGEHPSVMLAVRFLLPLPGHAEPANRRWRSAGRWLLPVGIMCGLSYALVFAGAWRWFGEYQYIRWMPAAMVLAMDLGFGGYRLLAGTVRLWEPTHGSGGPHGGVTVPGLVAALLIVVTKYAAFVSLPLGRMNVAPFTGDTAGWEELWRPGVIYHPLILMPIWGRWAMGLALAVGRAAPQADEGLRRMIEGRAVLAALTGWVIAAGITLWLCSVSTRDLIRPMLVPPVVLLAAYATAFGLARRSGGQTQHTVAAVGMAGELSFLFVYLGAISPIYWY